MEFSVPLRKIINLQSLLTDAISQVRITPRALARIAGKIISMGPALGPLSRLFTRQMYHQIEHGTHWDTPSTLNDTTRSELIFWGNEPREKQRIQN